MRGTIEQRGRDSWRITVRVGKGRQVRRLVRGQKDDAERARTTLLFELDRGIAADPGSITVEDFLVAHWLPEVRQRVDVTTADRYERVCRLHLIPSVGSVKLRDLRVLHVQQMVTTKLSSGRIDGRGGLSRQSVRDVLTVLSGALNQAVAWQLIATNPAKAIRLPRPVRAPFTVVDAGLARAVLEAVRGSDVEVPVTIALGTGLRRGEILGLRWSDLDLEDRTLRVRQSVKVSGGRYFLGTPKTERSKREVPIPAFVVSVLREHRTRQATRRLALGSKWQDLDLVIDSGDGGIRSPHGLTEAFATRMRRAGLPVKMHGLRHGYATLMLAAGEDLKVVSELMGHAGIQITANVYQDVIPRLKRDAAERLDRLMLGSDG